MNTQSRRLKHKMQPGDYWLHMGRTLYRVKSLNIMLDAWVGYEIKTANLKGEWPILFPLDMVDNEYWTFYTAEDLPAKFKLESL